MSNSEETPGKDDSGEDALRISLDRSDSLFGDVGPTDPPPDREAPQTRRPAGEGRGHTGKDMGRGHHAPYEPVEWPDLDADDAAIERPTWDVWRRSVEAGEARRAEEAEAAAAEARAHAERRQRIASSLAAADAQARAEQEARAQAQAAAAAAARAEAEARAAAAAEAKARAAAEAKARATAAASAKARAAAEAKEARAARVEATKKARAARAAEKQARRAARSRARSAQSTHSVTGAVAPGTSTRGLWQRLSFRVRVSLVLLTGLIVVTGIVAATGNLGARSRDVVSLGESVAVQPIGGPVPTVSNPTTIRLEVRSSTPGARARVTYGGDQGSVTETVTTPWAVDAAVTSANNSVRLRVVNAEADTGAAASTTFECRIALDGAPVETRRFDRSETCSVSPHEFYDDARTEGGAPLGTTAPAAPTTEPVPPLPKAPVVGTFEVGLSAPSTTTRITFGTASDADMPHLKDQSTPWARSVALPEGLRSLSVYASDYSGKETSTMRCQLRLDEVVVHESLGRYSASCDASVPRANKG